MESLNLVLFCGNSLGTSVLVSQLATALSEAGHKVTFVYRVRTQKVTARQPPHYYYIMNMLVEHLYPFLDQEDYVAGARAWSPEHLATKLGASVRYLTINELNAPEMLEFIQDGQFDGGISARFPYVIKPPILNALTTGRGRFLWNLHSATLPDYRGYSPMYWMLFNREPTATFSLHELKNEIDAGDIIAQRPIPLDCDADYYTNLLNLTPGTVEMTFEAIQQVAAGGYPETRPNVETPHTNYYPRLRIEHLPLLRTRVRFFNQETLIQTYLDYFSMPGTAHESRMRQMLEKAFAAGPVEI